MDKETLATVTLGAGLAATTGFIAWAVRDLGKSGMFEAGPPKLNGKQREERRLLTADQLEETRAARVGSRSPEEPSWALSDTVMTGRFKADYIRRILDTNLFNIMHLELGDRLGLLTDGERELLRRWHSRSA